MIPLPIRDHIRRQTFWVITLLLILANIWMFLFELSLGPGVDRLVYYFGLVPARYTTPSGLATASFDRTVLPVLVSMFLHGGWVHLLSNMLFLFVFGRSIEDRFGHVRFLFLYLASGIGAAFLHVVLNAGSRLPTVGASGAIAGVLGAYFVSFPGARITTLVPVFFFFWTFEVPALLLLGYWFALQFFSGLHLQAIQSATAGGVAWWAHVGGFVVGLLVAMALPPRRRYAAQVNS